MASFSELGFPRDDILRRRNFVNPCCSMLQSCDAAMLVLRCAVMQCVCNYVALKDVDL